METCPYVNEVRIYAIGANKFATRIGENLVKKYYSKAMIGYPKI